ncbi:DUF3095 family protein [Olleya aquimaris]|uniref:DUF3095 domain-containing protein n=1 Tax=Olleya aquimaris TaxID=639310 RepID=A0A327RPZ4_9FLAO|nr:DUF3095 family protein [Olleya aquimaris]RAJ18032.1 Protein of unknown function (DUF3095) [Olleya aquimaris]
MKDDLNFYRNIPKNNIPLSQLLNDESLFVGVPKNWFVVITDVENSTIAVANGQHNDVNLSATGSIITVLNTLKKLNNNIEAPYFFGGDGSTFLIPNAVLQVVLNALHNYAFHIEKTLGLVLRIGSLSLETVYNNNKSVRITKLRHNKYLTTPIILGNGLKYAEQIIKEKFNEDNDELPQFESLNLTGMECRWDEIYPDKPEKKVICLLVSCHDESKQAEIFGIIMNEINFVFGDLNQRNPISALQLKLNTSIEKIRREMYVKLGKYKRSYLITNWLITVFGKFYFKFSKAGKLYVYRVTQLSDTIMLDGSINTVMAGTPKQLSKLKLLLDDLESKNLIVYGLHSTYASIMSCYIEDREEKHIHFVDGTEGGYTSAAIVIKNKIKSISY